MQVDPIKPMLKAPGTKPSKVNYDELLSNVLYNFSLRRYSTGAARVRDIFARARDFAPCIVFIDEIDAVGKVGWCLKPKPSTQNPRP